MLDVQWSAYTRPSSSELLVLFLVKHNIHLLHKAHKQLIKDFSDTIWPKQWLFHFFFPQFAPDSHYFMVTLLTPHTLCVSYEFNGQGLGPLLDSQGEWSVDFRRASADAGPLWDKKEEEKAQQLCWCEIRLCSRRPAVEPALTAPTATPSPHAECRLRNATPSSPDFSSLTPQGKPHRQQFRCSLPTTAVRRVESIAPALLSATHPPPMHAFA